MNFRALLSLLFLTIMLSWGTSGSPLASGDFGEDLIEFGEDIIDGDDDSGGVSYGSSDVDDDTLSEEQCEQLDEAYAIALGCETEGQVLDFTEYTGELEGPEAEGYDEALTESTNARDFIQRIVNYALSFLGLIAVVIVIYGGMLYVTSRGDEEMATKGKKTLTYAAIGILIILGSFALVNTILGAGGGELGGGGGAGGEGETITETGASFDVDFVLDELEDISVAYLDTYKTFLSVRQTADYLEALEVPPVLELELGSYTLEELSTSQAVADYLNALQDGIKQIQSSVDSLSDSYEASQQFYNFLQTGEISAIPRRLSFIPRSFAVTVEESVELIEVIAEYEGQQGKACSEYPAFVSAESLESIDQVLCTYILLLRMGADSDYLEEVNELLDRLNELRLLFDTEQFDTGSRLTQILAAFDDEEEGAIPILENAQSDITANTVRDFVNSINTLHGFVTNIDFVQVRLSASATSGNAPLIVRFNVLGTEDPSGRTVENEQIEWDLDGDGNFEEVLTGTAVTAEDVSGDAVSATYNEPGTYRVRVRVRSQDEDVAAGISTVSIEVEPSKSKLVLTATAGGETTTLADFRAFPEIDLDSYKVTMIEAQNGILFDASETTDGDGNDGAAGGIVYYEWDLGDNESSAGKYGEDGGNKVTHAYGQEGSYNVSLTVTDDTGVEDRKFFTLFVASPAARVSVTPDSGTVGTVFEFDGSGSSTDIGQIISYQWTATTNGTALTLEESTGIVISASFDQPGLYTVTLQVADNTKSDTASVTVLVESTPPVATYEFSVPSSAEPATLLFDATKSFDPDEGDTISFEWDFDGVEGEDFEIVDSAEDLSEMTVQFLKTGDYDVALTVYDQHEGELRKSDTAVATIHIDSVLDLDLEIEGETARHLDGEGEAAVEFTALSEVGTAFEIDYGDSNTDFSDTVVDGQSIFTHTYESAGVFNVTLTALDDAGTTNSVTQRLYIGAGDSPIAVIEVGSEGEDIGTGESLHGTIKTKFTFDASESVNVDGSRENLEYSWNFGDGVTSSQTDITHIFEETAVYTVTLIVRDEDDRSMSNEASIAIRIEGIDPEIHGITITPQAEKLETPLKVNVSVEAEDEDGDINYVKGWYYDLNDTATELGTIIAESASFTLTVNTKGETGEVLTYGFAAEVTDNDNNTVSSFDELDPAEIPTLEVTNGPNESPVASFSVNKTSVYIGEEITFSSTSYDPDGEIVTYWWDIEGDGFYNNEPQESSSYVYSFTQIHPEGVPVQLKVEDSSGATATSESITIYVDAISEPPDAAFLTDVSGTTVTFRNNSAIDTDNGASLAGIYWDFNVLVDSNGNGALDDDYDSFEENPTYTYAALGSYQVKMTVVDSTGQSDTVAREVNVAESSPPKADFTYLVEDKTVDFENESTMDTANQVELRAYTWDFDLNSDSDGDTDPENDQDASVKNPTFEYADYGEFDVKLTIEDSVGKTDTVVKTVEVESPVQAVTALLTSTPEPNELGQVILEDDADSVSFFYGAEGGSGKFTYELDKNIFYDTDSDGIRDNDVDYEDDSSGSWKTPFYKSYGQIVVKLTVTDRETGESDVATLQVVFEGSLLGANLFNATPMEMLFLMLSALLIAILGISFIFRYQTRN